MSRTAENRAIVASVGGVVYPLYHRVDEALAEHIASLGDADAYDADHLPDGVWVVELALVADGPGDTTYDHECTLRLSDHRLPTREEWRRHVDDQHVWSVPSKD